MTIFLLVMTKVLGSHDIAVLVMVLVLGSHDYNTPSHDYSPRYS